MANPHPNYKLLLTGGRGGLGRAFPDSAYRLQTRLEAPLADWATELRSAKATGEASCLIHMAGMTLVDDCERQPGTCFHINVDCAVKVYEAAAYAGIERFIFVSTSHVYAPSQDPVDVTARLQPKSMYPRSKLLAETLLGSAAARLKSAPALAVARVFSLTGPGMKLGFLYPNLILRAERKDATPLPGYHNVRDFVPTSYAADRLTALAHSQDFPALVNISTGQGMTVGQLARQVYAENSADPELVTPADGRVTDANVQVGVPTEFR